MKVDCPHCGGRAVSPARKVILKPGYPVPCAACGKPVGVPWRSFAVGLPALAAVLVLLLLPGPLPSWIPWVIAVVATILVALAMLFLVPLEAQKHV
jgi:hypothetical protein